MAEACRELLREHVLQFLTLRLEKLCNVTDYEHLPSFVLYQNSLDFNFHDFLGFFLPRLGTLRSSWVFNDLEITLEISVELGKLAQAADITLLS